MKFQSFLKILRRVTSLEVKTAVTAQSVINLYQPSPILRNSFMQIIYDSLKPITKVDFKREKVFFQDGGHICLDWADDAKISKNSPLLIIMHGVTGGSESDYIRVLVSKAQEQGYRCVCINSRGINSELTSPFPYVGFDHHEFQAALLRIEECYPDSPIYLIGTSLGGNYLMRYLIKNQNKRIKGFVGLSLPFNVGQVIDRMGWFYQSFFVKTYIKCTVVTHPIMKHWEDIGLLKFDDIRKSKTIRQFHDQLTTKIFGFKNSHQLFDRFFISQEEVQKLNYPSFLMISKDDPIVPFQTIPIESLEKNKNIKVLVTDQGGHLCWFQGIRPQRWYPQPVFDFLKSLKNKQNI